MNMEEAVSLQRSAVRKIFVGRPSLVVGQTPTNPAIVERCGAIRSRMIPTTRISFYSSTKKLRHLAGAVSAFLMADG
jgi:hypothetical protein